MTLVVIVTEYFTQIHAPVRAIVKASKTGAGTNLITGLAMGMKNRKTFIIGMNNKNN